MEETTEKNILPVNLRKELTNMFHDQEFGFDVFVTMKNDEKTIKRVVFYEEPVSNQKSFKMKIQDSIVDVIKREYLTDIDQYALADNIADNQHKIYIIEQTEEYAPLKCLETAEATANTFSVSDYDNADAILFRFRRGTKSIWAYQSVNAVLIPNKKGENILVKAFSTEEGDRFIEMSDKIFTITKKVNLLVVDGIILTRDINFLQRHLGFEEYIRSRAASVVSDITAMNLVENVNKLTEYIQRTKKTYAKKMMRIKQYNVINLTQEELIVKINNTSRWKNIFKIKDGKICLDTFADVENLIDLFDERYTISLITDDEFDTDVKKIVVE